MNKDIYYNIVERTPKNPQQTNKQKGAELFIARFDKNKQFCLNLLVHFLDK